MPKGEYPGNNEQAALGLGSTYPDRIFQAVKRWREVGLWVFLGREDKGSEFWDAYRVCFSFCGNDFSEVRRAGSQKKTDLFQVCGDLMNKAVSSWVMNDFGYLRAL
jgi:hypothetical protein